MGAPLLALRDFSYFTPRVLVTNFVQIVHNGTGVAQEALVARLTLQFRHIGFDMITPWRRTNGRLLCNPRATVDVEPGREFPFTYQIPHIFQGL